MAANDDAGRGPVSRGGVAAQPLFAVAAVLLGAFLANFDSRLTTVGLPDTVRVWLPSKARRAGPSITVIGAVELVVTAVVNEAGPARMVRWAMPYPIDTNASRNNTIAITNRKRMNSSFGAAPAD